MNPVTLWLKSRRIQIADWRTREPLPIDLANEVHERLCDTSDSALIDKPSAALFRIAAQCAEGRRRG